jgi:hypothetical protein
MRKKEQTQLPVQNWRDGKTKQAGLLLESRPA